MCDACLDFEEPACAAFPTLTYGGRDNRDGLPTRGAYSREYVVTERFVYPLPSELDPAAAAPLMCAGLTTWDPLRKNGTGPGDRVGVVGLGGLGHMAVKFAVALGADVTVFTTSPVKRDAAAALGAAAVLSTDVAAMAVVQGTFDLVLDTVPVKHDPTPYLHAVHRGGTVCMLGLPDRYEPEALALLGKRLTASGGAGTRSTSAMLAFCGEHNITAEVEILPLNKISTALERLARNDVRYRFVLDVAAP